MSGQERLPTVVIVGRPNVGKSTLFNCISGSRRAIVGNEPGITRDRIYQVAEHRGRRFELIDTGGILPGDKAQIPVEVLKQARVALEGAAHIVFLIDGRAEITATDRELAQILRKLGKPVVVAVNKIDVAAREILAHEFHTLGFPDVMPVSAEHRLGLEELLDHVTAAFPAGAGEESKTTRSIRVAIIGRPNVGKSTLLNALTGQERAIVTPVAGTTRDAVDEAVSHNGVEYVFVDTAGIRRKGKTRLMAEKLSVVMARRHIRMADVALILLDATEGVVGLDATISGYAHEEGRAVLIGVNKWDAAEGRNKPAFTEQVRDQMKFLDYAPVAFFSAKTGAGVPPLFGLLRRSWEAACRRITTGELNRFLEKIEFDRDVRVRYITQAGVRPPTFVVFTDEKRPLHFSSERFLVNQLRRQFDFAGTPIVVKTKVREKRRRAGR